MSSDNLSSISSTSSSSGPNAFGSGQMHPPAAVAAARNSPSPVWSDYTSSPTGSPPPRTFRRISEVAQNIFENIFGGRTSRQNPEGMTSPKVAGKISSISNPSKLIDWEKSTRINAAKGKIHLFQEEETILAPEFTKELYDREFILAKQEEKKQEETRNRIEETRNRIKEYLERTSGSTNPPEPPPPRTPARPAAISDPPPLLSPASLESISSVPEASSDSVSSPVVRDASALGPAVTNTTQHQTSLVMRTENMDEFFARRDREQRPLAMRTESMDEFFKRRDLELQTGKAPKK